MRGNMYNPHPFMIDNGTFWRCWHGLTGYREDGGFMCWRCWIRKLVRFD